MPIVGILARELAPSLSSTRDPREYHLENFFGMVRLACVQILGQYHGEMIARVVGLTLPEHDLKAAILRRCLASPSADKVTPSYQARRQSDLVLWVTLSAYEDRG